jgi:hypothetical protein
MRPSLIALLLLLPLTAAAEDQAPFEIPLPLASGTDLLAWCRSESEAVLVGRGHSPRNWTARHIEQGNALRVEGAWRVDGRRHEVECRAPHGARPGHATLHIEPG